MGTLKEYSKEPKNQNEMHRVIEVFEITEPLLVMPSLAVIAEDEGAGEETPCLHAHIENIDSACSFNEPEDEGGNDDDRVRYGVKQTLITRSACPFAHIDFNIRGGLDGSLEEIVHDFRRIVDAKKHDKSIDGITASKELREERRPNASLSIKRGIGFAEVAGVA